VNPMPIWELVVVGLACLLGAFSIFLPLLIGELLDQREEARVARTAPMPTAASPEHDHASRKSAA
jgi:hypothetical protein